MFEILLFIVKKKFQFLQLVLLNKGFLFEKMKAKYN